VIPCPGVGARGVCMSQGGEEVCACGWYVRRRTILCGARHVLATRFLVINEMIYLILYCLLNMEHH
jgi:hypothetical protein